VLVSLTTGHFHGAAGQEAFIEGHGDDLLRRAAAALTIEHLGALRWRAGATRSHISRRAEPALFFVPESSALVRAARAAAARSGTGPTIVARPIGAAPVSPRRRGYPAEGNALWTRAGIPTANFITGPTYLFNWGRSTMDKFDAGLMRSQTVAFTEMLLRLSLVPRSRLRRLDLL
jgi:hypothetical protein